MHSHKHAHARTHAHTDWACITCSDVGFLFLTLFSQSAHVRECIVCMCICVCVCVCVCDKYGVQTIYITVQCVQVGTFMHKYA